MTINAMVVYQVAGSPSEGGSICLQDISMTNKGIQDLYDRLRIIAVRDVVITNIIKLED